MNVLTKAFADSERSYHAAKASVGSATDALLARAPSGLPITRSDLSKASEQLRHFSGWVYASIRAIAQRIAGQPIHVGRVKGSNRMGTKAAGDVEALDNHPLLDLLADPNDLMVAWSLMFTTVASLELTGRALWWLPKQEQILPIPTSWLQGFDGSTKYSSFRVRPPGTAEAIPLPADECAYFCYPDPSDPHGAVSPLQAVGGAVDADEAMTASQISMFRQGIHPSHVVTVGKDPHPDVPGGMRPRLSDAQRREIISAIQKRYQGVARHGEPLILDGLIEDCKRLSNTAEEMDYLDSGKVTKARIMQGFGVNPIIAGEVEGANRASATAADKHFVDFTVNPKIELLSQCMSEWLTPMFGGKIKVWIEPCVADDADMTLAWATMLAQQGALSASELRSLAPFQLPEQEAERASRSLLLGTVGGMTGAVALFSAMGQGAMSPETVAQLLALFFELPLSQARAIVGAQPSAKSVELASRIGVVSPNELRRLAGLPARADYEHIDMDARTADPLADAIGKLIDGRLADLAADRLLEGMTSS
jgi:phage portal protein BeeE